MSTLADGGLVLFIDRLSVLVALGDVPQLVTMISIFGFVLMGAPSLK